MEALDRLVRLWDTVSDEDKQGMARTLFEYVVYDLDTQRITDFRLKPWAERYLVLRMALYEVETPKGGSGPLENEKPGKPPGFKGATILRPHGDSFPSLDISLSLLVSSVSLFRVIPNPNPRRKRRYEQGRGYFAQKARLTLSSPIGLA